jgi:hypothetical protein
MKNANLKVELLVTWDMHWRRPFRCAVVFLQSLICPPRKQSPMLFFSKNLRLSRFTVLKNRRNLIYLASFVLEAFIWLDLVYWLVCDVLCVGLNLGPLCANLIVVYIYFVMLPKYLENVVVMVIMQLFLYINIVYIHSKYSLQILSLLTSI